MNIEHGLMPGQVLQRDKRGFAAASVKGGANADGVVECSIRKGVWKAVGTAKQGEFAAVIEGIPTGGPYTVSLRVKGGDSITVTDICVGDVWFLGGQSNMEGIGDLAGAPKPHPLVRSFYMRDEWGVAEEPIHFLPESVDPVHGGPRRPADETLAKMRRERVKGVSPAVFFALEMFRRGGVPQGLVPCAQGGTSMAQWSPELRGQGGDSLYGAMLRRFEKLGQPAAGVLWFQGENDTGSTEDTANYTERMIALVAAVRRDMKLPRLPWLMAQLGRHIDKFNPNWNELQEQQRLLSGQIPRLDVVPSVDLVIDDPIHIGGAGQPTLGRRLARAAARLAQGDRKSKPSIAYAGCEVIPVNTLTESTVRVKYRNVAGKLRSEGRPHGFTLHDASGAVVERGVFKVSLEKDEAVLGVWLPLRSLPGHSISYGYGMYPYCNIVDDEGMGLPAMLRQPLGVRPVLSYDLLWHSSLLRAAGGMEDLELNHARACRSWKPCEIGGGFVALPCPLGGDRAGTYAMKTTATCSEPLKAELQVGADSPFILWVNGEKVLEDLAATNPVTPEEYKAVVNLKQGENELVAVLDTRQGAGWGLCLTMAERPGDAPLFGRVSY